MRVTEFADYFFAIASAPVVDSAPQRCYHPVGDQTTGSNAMLPDEKFRDLIGRVRRGDPEAARSLVEQYEPMIRRVVRFRLTDSRLRAAFDSIDICQSVLGSFFVRAANGEYDVAGPADLTRLLVGIARNKLAAQARRQAADKRDYKRAKANEVDAEGLAGNVPSPSRYAEAKELLQAVRARFSAEEQQLAQFRQNGMEWIEIAEKVGDNPVALRKRFSRALDRVAGELGLDEDAE
jgi:RNA polymerase sigma factor (sigma-70 family)